MPEHPVRAMFDQIVAEPDAEFVERLRRQVLEELLATSQVDEHRIEQPNDRQRGLRESQRRRLPTTQPPPVNQRRRRRLAVALLAAAVVAAMVTVGVLTRSTSSHRIVPSTNSEPSTIGYDRHVVADLKTPDGYSFRFEGDVILRTAVESDENNYTSAAQSDVLFTPSISGSLTNATAGTAVPLARLSVQLFLRTDSINCLVNNGGCEPAIIRELANVGTPSSIAEGGAVELVDSHAISRTRVARADVPTILSQVRDGSLVTGIAIVVVGGSIDQIATEIFDAEGNPVVSCGLEPSDCMDASRSILGAPASPSAQTVPSAGPSAPPQFPPGEIPPGTYSVDKYVLTTYDKWRVYTLNKTFILLARDDSIVPGFGIINQSLSLMPTADSAIAQICPLGSVDFSEPTPTTFFGGPALALQGEVTGTCTAPDLYPITAAPGSRLTIRLVAGEVGGSMVVAFAYAPPDQWANFSKEIDATVASLRLGSERN